MTQELSDFRMLRMQEDRASLPRVGPCLLCGVYQIVLRPGRSGGFNVYCESCAMTTRTPARLREPE